MVLFWECQVTIWDSMQKSHFWKTNSEKRQHHTLLTENKLYYKASFLIIYGDMPVKEM